MKRDGKEGEQEDLEELAMKETTRARSIKSMDEVRRNNHNEDDALSEQQEEIMNEIDEQMDGIVKVAKDVTGYEDEAMVKDDQSSEFSEIKDTKKEEEKDTAGVSKYTKPLREAHSKYLQYLKKIEFDQKRN